MSKFKGVCCHEFFSRLFSIDYLRGPGLKLSNFQKSVKTLTEDQFEMETDVLRVKSVLYDLQKFVTKENEISSLTTLNKIISSSQEEIDFLYNSNGIDIIITFLESDSKLANICLKILANASKRHKKVRGKLVENNILQLLTVKLKNERDFCSNTLILHLALIVVLVQGNYEAQNQMRTTGCLSSVLHILSCILDAEDSKPLPSKTAELLIYATIASNKGPRHTENQIQVGRITPKVLEYLEKHMIFSGCDQLQLIKCFWFLLKTALDRNELNQQIFLSSCGLSVLFRSIQSVVDDGNCEEMGDLLVKMTGVLVKFKSNREFLYQASNYCPVMILGSLLKTSNILVLQQTIIFLDCLTREFPKAFETMRDNGILRRMEKTKIFLLKNKMPIELCQNLWNRMKIFYETQASQIEHSLNSKLQLHFSLNSDDGTLREIRPELNFLQSHFCVVHDVHMIHLQNDLEPPTNPTTEEKDTKGRVEIPRKHRFFKGNLILSRKDSRQREKKLRKIISQNFSPSPTDNGNSYNIVGIVGRRIVQIFQQFLTFFIGCPMDDFNNRFSCISKNI